MKQQEYATMAATKDVVGLLQEMISDARGKNLIVTETIPYATAGRPMPSTTWSTPTCRGSAMSGCRSATRTGAFARGCGPFNEWMRKRNLNPKHDHRCAEGTHYHVTQSKQTIGAGVPGLDATDPHRTDGVLRSSRRSLALLAPSPGSDAPN